MARRRSRKASNTAGSLAGIGLVLIAVSALSGLGYYLFLGPKAPQLNTDTLCPESGPTAHLAILVDTTDPLSLTELQGARQRIEGAIAVAEIGTRISFSTVSSNETIRNEVFFSLCKPAAREDANILNENPRLVQERFQYAFVAPLNRALDKLLNVPVSDTSPIMESTQEFGARIPGFSTDTVPRQLLIVSDLIQHSDAFSFFRGGTWESFSASGGPNRFGESFNSSTVRVLRIPRLPDRTAVVDDFWVQYFEAQGFNRVQVEQIGDL